MVNFHYFVVVLILLILFSAFFSAAETGLMAINRYRLRHLARKGNLSAKLVAQLLERPDRLLSMILIGNTLCNVMASAVATILATHYLSDLGVVFATLGLTLVLLIFSEITPKTLAAWHPQKVAFATALPLKFLLTVFYPFVWLVTGLANGILRMLRIRPPKSSHEALTAEELRTVVREASGKIISSHQQILLRVLELEQMTVEDVMVPRNDINGIDLAEDWHTILQQLINTEHAYLPVYRDHIDHVLGILSLRKVLPSLAQPNFNKEQLIALMSEVYFIPEVTRLNRQLLNFQKEQKSIGLVVDEYGDIEGLVTLQDILEEIIGGFTPDADIAEAVQLQADGSYIVDGNINLRDLNRVTGWHLPTDGPKTLSGLIIEYLEMIPTAAIALRLGGYLMEVLDVQENTIRTVQIWPAVLH